MSDTAPRKPKRAKITFDDAVAAPSAAAAAAVQTPEEALEERRARLDEKTYDAYGKYMKDKNGPLLRELEARGETINMVSVDDPMSPQPRDAETVDEELPAAPRAPVQAPRTALRDAVPQPTRIERERPAAPADPAAERAPFNAKIFITHDDLPSKGVTYPAGATVAYRPYMLGEIEEFDNSEMNPRERFLRILQGVETRNMDRMELTFGDVFYLGLLRKIATIDSEEFGLDTVCPACEGGNTVVLQTGDVEFTPIQAPKAPAALNLSFGRHEFWPLTIGDWIQIQDLGLKPNTLNCTAATCHSMEFPASIEQFGTVIDPHDVALIQRLDQLFYHGPTPVTISCANHVHSSQGESAPCGRAYRVRLENSAEAFLYPFRRAGSDVADEIEFG